ncbi:MAG TPA: hypothetical protein VN641_08615 [Urbifossiella sp.]|nr:hypothetical protein [Urbifossiella sp.]
MANVYLQPGHELSGPDFARLWSTTSVFGKQRSVAGAFWHAGSNSGGQRRIELGSLEHVQPLLERGPQPIFGGGTCSKAKLARSGTTLDCDFYYAHGGASRSYGVDTLPDLLFTVSGQWFENTGPETVLEMMRLHFEIADKYAPPYGLIDVSPAHDCYAGMVYGPTFFGNAPLHRHVEDINWVFSGAKKRDRVRGIYWGNYFGPAILGRLGGRDHFLTGFRQQATLHGDMSARIWEFTNGVFVSLSLDPLDLKPNPPDKAPPPLKAPMLAWLVCELGSRGALCAWG